MCRSIGTQHPPSTEDSTEKDVRTAALQSTIDSIATMQAPGSTSSR
jgi:hypothetical protein